MRALSLALAHLLQGTTYSWDLTILLGMGIPLSAPLRLRLLRGSPTREDADFILARLRERGMATPWEAAGGQSSA